MKLFFQNIDQCRDKDEDGYASVQDGGLDCNDESSQKNVSRQPSQECLAHSAPYAPCYGERGRASYCNDCSGCDCNVCTPIPTKSATAAKCPRYLEIMDVHNFDEFFLGVYERNEHVLVNGRTTYVLQKLPQYAIQYYSAESRCGNSYNQNFIGRWILTELGKNQQGHVYFAFDAHVGDALLLPENTDQIHYWDHQAHAPRTARFKQRMCRDDDNDGHGSYLDGGKDCDDTDATVFPSTNGVCPNKSKGSLSPGSVSIVGESVTFAMPSVTTSPAGLCPLLLNYADPMLNKKGRARNTINTTTQLNVEACAMSCLSVGVPLGTYPGLFVVAVGQKCLSFSYDAKSGMCQQFSSPLDLQEAS